MKRLAPGAALAMSLTVAAVTLMAGTASAQSTTSAQSTASAQSTTSTQSNGPAQGTGHAANADRHFYTTKTPYSPQESLRNYQAAPKGFVPVFTENVARHGSRAMSDSDDGDAVLAVLRAAADQGALTGLGTRLGPQVESLLAGGASIGYGNLSGRGVQEQQQTALRMEQRLPSLFSAIVAKQEPIEVETSGVDRAVASANAFTGGLTTGDPALAGLIGAPVTDKDLLYFHKQPQNADYQAYLDSDPDLAAVIAEVDGQPKTARTAKEVVSRLFTRGFVAAMATDDQISFARSLYELYSAVPDLRVEAPGVNLDAFLPAQDAQWFAYLDDAEEFYQKGPAFSGRTITYDMANVLLDDLFAQVEDKADGTSDKGAVLRFTHAEEIEPLAVLLDLPGSTKAADLSRPYTYQNNPWRGENVAPMAANVQWDLYAKPSPTGGASTKPTTEYLVRMLYNEKETAFSAACRPIAKGSYFYDLNELERCFHRS
ncbi:histidine-type phosphatase [Rugosimonospora africana]|uniref:Multiple inositol polyphosphate phosphatase 1 n=1 Tax=Rugosimonospora africana TaxID=556532 RepID=A0A8J3QYM3_9ACTN|nr:histidine-type phosphatase [Rugosimonospora africana]GIH18482.1 histidine phosphatase [Rugosimonospora africana]